MLLQNVPEGRCDRSLARSAWNSATPKEPSVGYGLIRAAMRAKFDDWSDEISFSYKPGQESKLSPDGLVRRTFRREIPLELAAPDHTGTLLDGSFEGRFPRRSVPGYDRCCLSRTRLQTFRNRL